MFVLLGNNLTAAKLVFFLIVSMFPFFCYKKLMDWDNEMKECLKVIHFLYMSLVFYFLEYKLF